MPKTLVTTKHFHIAQLLRKELRKMKPGDPLPTVLELRREFGASQATIERALDRLRGEGLIVRPPGQLRPVVAEAPDPAAHHVALIRPDYPSPTFEELARVIVEAGKGKDWAFDLVYYRKLETLNLRRAIGENEAAILLPTTEPFPKHVIAALRRPRCPVVVIQDPPPGLRVSSVRIDDEQIGRLAVRHLYELGHRRILLFLSEPLAPSGQLREAGWREEMTNIGESNLDELVVAPNLRPFDNSLVKSYEYFSQWLSRPHPPFTAIFCAAWTGALAALRALREHNFRVPKDVSVVSHGGEGYIGPFLSPALTAVETDIATYGRKVIALLQKHFDHPEDPVQHLTIPSSLVIRETTAKASRPI